MRELLQVQRGLTAIVGSGGKTTLLRCLAQELSAQGAVVVATSTKMFVPDWCPVLLDASACEVRVALGAGGLVCVGSLHQPTGKLAEPLLSFEELAQLAPYVLVEADGAKMLPLKAHAAHEPVVPANANQVICVVGIDGVGHAIQDVCHRPQRFAQLAGASVCDAVTPRMVADVLRAEALGQRVLINKVASDKQWEAARRIAAGVDCPVVAGSLWEGAFACL